MKRLVLIVSIVVLTLTGCSLGLSQSKESEYYAMKQAADIINTDVDIEKYDQAVLFLVSTDTVNADKIAENKEKFSDIIDKSIFDKMEEAVGSLKSVPIGDMDNSAGANIVSNKTTKDKNGQDAKNGSYPIYDGHFYISGYGTKEQSDESIAEFKKLPDNRIDSVNYYGNIMTFRIDNKYSGIYMLRVKIADGKIKEYTKFTVMR